MKYVYGARKLNETNADDRSEHDHASTVEFTRCDSFPIYHRDSTLFPPSLSSFSFTSSSSSSLDVSREVATLPLPTIDAILPPSPRTRMYEWRGELCRRVDQPWLFNGDQYRLSRGAQPIGLMGARAQGQFRNGHSRRSPLQLQLRGVARKGKGDGRPS